MRYNNHSPRYSNRSLRSGSHSPRLVLTIIGIVLSACSSQQSTSAQPSLAPSPEIRASIKPSAAIANGRAIFLSGKDIDGVKITANEHPLFARCADCHRADGSGGKHFSDGSVSADLRQAALVVHQKHPYTVPLLERAISRGIDNEGKPLDPVMPRWKLSARDLHDIAHYVFTQLK